MKELDSDPLDLTIVSQKALDELNKRIINLEENLHTLIKAIANSQVAIEGIRKRLDILSFKK